MVFNPNTQSKCSRNHQSVILLQKLTCGREGGLLLSGNNLIIRKTCPERRPKSLGENSSSYCQLAGYGSPGVNVQPAFWWK